jgi:hypothetical protein
MNSYEIKIYYRKDNTNIPSYYLIKEASNYVDALNKFITYAKSNNELLDNVLFDVDFKPQPITLESDDTFIDFRLFKNTNKIRLAITNYFKINPPYERIEL